MKKFLQLDSKNISISLLEQATPCLIIEWNLNFTCLIQNISICLNNNYIQSINIEQIKLYAIREGEQHQEIMIIKRQVEANDGTKPIFFQALVLQNVGYLMNKLEVQIEVSKQDAVLVDNLSIKNMGFEGLQIKMWNMDIYQSLEDKDSLLNIYSKLLCKQQSIQSNIAFFHLGLIAKNSAKFFQAQQIFLKLLKSQTSKTQIGQNLLILNLIDCSPKQTKKLEYLFRLCNQQPANLSDSNFFKLSQFFIQNLLKHFKNNHYILATTVFNVFNFFINKVGCSAAGYFEVIIDTMFSVFEQKSYMKIIKREAYPNYEVLISCIQQFLDGIRQCVLFLATGYIQRLCQYLLSYIYQPSIQPVQQFVLKLLHTLIKQLEGGVEVDYDEWFRLIFLVQGDQLFKGMQIEHNMFFNKQLKGTHIFYDDYKKNILVNLTWINKKQFLDSLFKNFTEIVYNKNVNSTLINYFVQTISLFCYSASQRLMFDYSCLLVQFFNPFKALIYKLIERNAPQPDFKKIWEIFLHLFSLIRNQISQSLNDIILTMLSRFTRDGMNNKQSVFIFILVGALQADGKFPEFFWQKFLKQTADIMPNSIYSEKIYKLAINVIALSPGVLESDALNYVIQRLIDPYSQYREQWNNLAIVIRNTILGNDQLFLTTLKPIIEPYRNKKRSKTTDTEFHKKYQIQLETRKVYFIDKMLAVDDHSHQTLQLITSVCERIPLQMNNYPQQMKLIMYYKYYFLRRVLVCYQVPIGVTHFNILSMQYPPIIFSFLISIAHARSDISQDSTKQLIKHLKVLSNQPWRNIQQLSIGLLIFFSKDSVEQSGAFVNELIQSKQIYKMMMALTVIYQKISQSLDTDKITEFVRIIQPSIKVLNSPNPLKQLELLSQYVLFKLSDKYSLDMQIAQTIPTEQDQQLILITFDYENRINSSVKKDMDKPIESILKLSDTFAIPRKTFRQQVFLDEVQIIDKSDGIEQQKAPDSIDNQYNEIKQKNNKSNQKDQKKADTINQTNLKNIKLSPSSQKKYKQEKKQKSQQDQSDKFQDINQNPVKKLTSSIRQSTPRVRTQYQSNTKPKDKDKATKGEIKKHKHSDSPVIQIQSKHSKFKINLGQLNQTWRDNLNLISKKGVKTKTKKNNKDLF